MMIISVSGDDLHIGVENIRKIYENGVIALDNVTAEFKSGCINCLLGENGAGKSTLAKLIAGVIRPTAGKIRLNGKEIRFRDSQHALRLGIGIVYQYPTLFEELTVLENIIVFNNALGKVKGFHIRNTLEIESREFEKFVKETGFNIDINKKVFSLPANEKQLIEILRLFYANLNVIILDEATSMLTPLETEKVFKMLFKLRDEGRNIIYITHKLLEVRQVCDRVIVLSRGRVVYVAEEKPETAEEMNKIIQHMFETHNIRKYLLENKFTQNNHYLRTAEKNNAEILKIKELYVLGDYGELKVKGLNLVINKNEIVGLAGIMGHGQRELIEAIVGIRKAVSGEIFFSGHNIVSWPIDARLKQGLVYIPAERLKRAIAGELSILEDISAYWLNISPFDFIKKFFGLSLVDYSKLRSQITDILKRFNVVYQGIEAPVKHLSGGNIQKHILAKILGRGNIKLIIAEEPTAGLDFKTTNEIRSLLKDLKENGTSILLISSDLQELLEISDRLLVMFDGKIVKEYANVSSIDVVELSKYMMGLR